MKILLERFDDFSEVAPAVRSFLETLAKSYNIQDVVECVFIGKNSTYKKRQQGDSFKGLSYEDSFIIVVDTKLKGSAGRIQTLASGQGLIHGINSVDKIPLMCFISMFKNISKQKIKEMSDEERN